jgi:hypothetical protein
MAKAVRFLNRRQTIELAESGSAIGNPKNTVTISSTNEKLTLPTTTFHLQPLHARTSVATSVRTISLGSSEFEWIRIWSSKDDPAMETTRLMARLSAALLIATTMSVACLRPTQAQNASAVLASNGSAVAHNISQPSERVEMIVKSSRILTLEERIPKFQVYNELVVGATPVSQNQIDPQGGTKKQDKND